MSDSSLPAPSETDSDLLFGAIAIRRGLVTPDQVQVALREQGEMAQAGQAVSLGEVLVRHQFMTAAQVEQLARYQAVARDIPWELLREREKRIGPYEIIAKLGKGGMGAVYMAREGAEGRLIALKVLPPRLANDNEYLVRFEREIRNLASMDHPNIVSGLASGHADGFRYLVMDFVQGENVFQILERDGILSPRRALDICLQVARALVHAESRGIVHRDIKPENVIIDVHGQVKITDFGLSKNEEDSSEMRVTRPGQTVGTPYYISPEQAIGKYEDVDARSDIYSLGATLFHMVTGRTPFEGENTAVVLAMQINDTAPWVRDVNPDVPTDLSYIIDKMMKKDPGERYASPASLLDDLERFRAGKKPRARLDVEPAGTGNYGSGVRRERRDRSERSEGRRARHRQGPLPAEPESGGYGLDLIMTVGVIVALAILIWVLFQ